MVACDIHDGQDQQMHEKSRCLRLHLASGKTAVSTQPLRILIPSGVDDNEDIDSLERLAFNLATNGEYL